MHNDTRKSVADSLETGKDFLPYLPYLIQDLWAMGSAVNQVLDLIGSLQVESPPAKLLDLGCGKGAVIIRAAEKYGFIVTGIDAMPEFLKIAQKKAAEYGVSHLCTFIEQDILKYVENKHYFDMVILASLGGVFGRIKKTVEKMRAQVTSGGYIIIDDGFLRNQQKLNRKGYGHYRDYAQTVEELTAFNDQIVGEVSTTDSSKKINYEYLTVIEKRGQELAARYPELKRKIEKYIDLQREECEVLDREVEGMIWVLKKTGG